MLVGLEVLTGTAGIVGGMLLIVRPDGSLLYAELSALAGSPSSDWRIPGILLSTLVGGGLLVAGVWQRCQGWHARELSMFSGAGLIAFECAELAWIGFQPLETLSRNTVRHRRGGHLRPLSPDAARRQVQSRAHSASPSDAGKAHETGARSLLDPARRRCPHRAHKRQCLRGSDRTCAAPPEPRPLPLHARCDDRRRSDHDRDGPGPRTIGDLRNAAWSQRVPSGRDGSDRSACSATRSAGGTTV
jgi:hypothetical protein